jgi:hypothetical protein
MIDRLKLTLGGVWLIAGLSALIFPIFLPSIAGAPGMTSNVLGVSTVAMFLLSFPSSLAAIPLIEIINPVFGVTNSVPVAYINLLLLFGVGYAQWFWLYPRLFGSDSFLQKLDLRGARKNPRLFVKTPDLSGAWIDADGGTPLERVLSDERKEKSES